MADRPREVEVCFSPYSFPLFYNPEAIVVVIDILRATSAICTAFHYGVKEIIPVATVEEAKRYKDKGFLAAAERHAEVVDGFDFGNSPFSYMNQRVKGQTIALTTTNGTQAIDAAKEAYKVVIGSFLNLDILNQWLLQQNKDVILLCAGWKNKFNLEDTLFAGAVARTLQEKGNYETFCDSTLSAKILYDKAENDLYAFLETSSHRKRLQKLNLEKDIRYCLQKNITPVIPVLEKGKLVNIFAKHTSTVV